MRVKVHLPQEAHRLLLEMGEDGALSPEDLIQVATYNLIALYLRERGKNVQGMDGDEPDLVRDGSVPDSGVGRVSAVVGK